MMIILELLELQILAAARGREHYYGLSAGREYRQSEIYYAVHQMLQSGILKKNGDGLEIQQPLSRYLDWMEEGRRVLVIDRSGGLYPRQCLYAAKEGCLCLECSTTDEARVFLYELGNDELSGELGESGQLPRRKVTEDIGIFDFEDYQKQHTDPEIRSVLQQGCEAGTEALLEHRQVYGCFSLHDKSTGELLERLILLDLPLEYGMVLQERGGEVRFAPYQREQALEIINSWWRAES